MSDQIPRVIMVPMCGPDDADPEAQEALRAMKENLLNAMQGYKDGRYPSFQDACEAITGERPRVVEAPHPPKYGYFLAVGSASNGKKLAVITDGHPNMHDDFEVMTIRRVESEEEAAAWFDTIAHLLPWRRLEGDVDIF